MTPTSFGIVPAQMQVGHDVLRVEQRIADELSATYQGGLNTVVPALSATSTATTTAERWARREV